MPAPPAGAGATAYGRQGQPWALPDRPGRVAQDQGADGKAGTDLGEGTGIGPAASGASGRKESGGAAAAGMHKPSPTQDAEGIFQPTGSREMGDKRMV